MVFSEQHLTQILSAIHFSAEKHRHQRRKDPAASPYINHPIQVAELLWRVAEVRDPDIIVAAILHDTIEDTQTTPDEILGLFGKIVLNMVLEVTDDPSLIKSERKQKQIATAAALSPAAKVIRLADKICNVRDVTHSPPRGWDTLRRKEYYDWTEKVVAGLRGVNPALELFYDQVLAEGHALIP